MVDPMHDTIRNDPKTNWICNLDKKRRDARGLTHAGRKHRGLCKKGDKAHKVRPSKRQSWIRRNTTKLLQWSGVIKLAANSSLNVPTIF